MKPFLIVNPRAANGTTGRHFDDISAAVRAAVGEHGHAFTERPMHASELARRALREGADLVIAVGGDGTINEVVNGFFEAPGHGDPPRPVRPGAALGILPRGTGGDLRRTVGLEGDLRACAPRLTGERRPIDVGRIDFVDGKGQPTARYFINVAEAGVGSDVVRIANSSSKLLGGKLTFALASLRALAGWRDVPVRWSLDGGPFQEGSVTTFAVANGRCFGGGMVVAPGALLDDGVFHVTIWSGYSLSDFVLRSAAMYDGSHVKLKGTRTATARSVRLEPLPGARGPLDIEADGELIGRLPATFTVVPGVVRLVS
ncbi:MAG: diacylglycerol kinase family lipid kinase [Deltaproteobacteria bacterium]|nr:MAG: diacylglycerol kinase family lipid kinase [Deltaproteobacteria bacterium]